MSAIELQREDGGKCGVRSFLVTDPVDFEGRPCSPFYDADLSRKGAGWDIIDKAYDATHFKVDVYTPKESKTMKCDKCGQDVPGTPFEQAWEASQHGKVGPITAKTFWDKCADAFAADMKRALGFDVRDDTHYRDVVDQAARRIKQ